MHAPKIYASFNKQIVLLHELKVPIEDRAYLFGDAVYEVLRIYNGQPFLFDVHMARLTRSLDSMGIAGVADLTNDILANIALNDITEGMVYVQISRGTAPRLHSFHNQALTPNILIYAKHFGEHPAERDAKTGITAITHDDLRWGRCDIKSVNLLANCLAQSHAHDMGAQDAILIRDGYLTEGSSSNVFVVKGGVIKTPPLSNHILPGTRRHFLIAALKQAGHQVIETPIPKADLFDADEVFITSSIKEAIAIVNIDQKPINKGQVGLIATLARKLIIDASKMS